MPVPSFASWEELNAYLLDWCEREKEAHLSEWQEEQRALQPLPPTPFSAARPLPVKVSTYSLVTVDRNRYSVPCSYVGQALIAKVFVDRIEIVDRDRIVPAIPAATSGEKPYFNCSTTCRP